MLVSAADGTSDHSSEVTWDVPPSLLPSVGQGPRGDLWVGILGGKLISLVQGKQLEMGGSANSSKI